MKLSISPETVIEQIGFWLGLVPTPLFETHISATLARTIMAGTELGIFECLEQKALAGPSIATHCALDSGACALLLEALEGCGYLSLADEKYDLSAKSRKWLLRSSTNSVRDKILLQSVEWRWLAHLEDYVRTGKPLDFHATMSDSERGLYHSSMRAIAGIAGREVAWRTPVPRGAGQMLDLGGSHGHFSACLCRRYPQLSAQVLELPDAIEKAAPLLFAEDLGSRVVHVAGDVMLSDLGREQYDLIFMSNLAHHFGEAQNHELATRAARALKANGVFVIQDVVRSESLKSGQTASLLGLYFALQGRPGARAWTIADIRRWQTDAGLVLHKLITLRTAPGWVQQAGTRR